GQGLAALRSRLLQHASSLGPRSRDDGFRLPVDRAFSVAGVGTVLTGTAWSGSGAVGDAVRLRPGEREGRVRSLESHGRSVERTEPGARIAVGIAGVDRADVQRGHVLVTPDQPWVVTGVLDTEVALLPSAPRALAARTRVRLHLGTAEVMARVLPREPIGPGAAGLARLRLEAPLIARGGDRFVLRSFSPVTTSGGGRVLDPSPPARGARWPAQLRSADPGERLEALIERRPFGMERGPVPVLTGMAAAMVPAALRARPGITAVGSHLVPARLIAELTERALRALKEFHRREPAERGMPLETLRRSARCPEWLAEAAIAGGLAARRLTVDGGI